MNSQELNEACLDGGSLFAADNYLTDGNSFDSEESPIISESVRSGMLCKQSVYGSAYDPPEHILALGALVDRLVSCKGASSVFQPLNNEYECDDTFYTQDFTDMESYVTDDVNDNNYSRAISWDDRTLETTTSSLRSRSYLSQRVVQAPRDSAGILIPTRSTVPSRRSSWLTPVGPSCGCTQVVSDRHTTMEVGSLYSANESPAEVDNNSKPNGNACEDHIEIDEKTFLRRLNEQKEAKLDDITTTTSDLSYSNDFSTSSDTIRNDTRRIRLVTPIEDSDNEWSGKVETQDLEERIASMGLLDEATNEVGGSQTLEASDTNKERCSSMSLKTNDESASEKTNDQAFKSEKTQRKWKLKGIRKLFSSHKEKRRLFVRDIDLPATIEQENALAEGLAY